MMERLTNKREADQQRKNYEKRLEQGYPRNIPEERFLKLAYYEDMEEQGRLVVLPCKVGDKVYSKDGKAAEIEGFYVEKRSVMAQVSFVCDYDCEYCAFSSWHTEYSGENSCDGEYGTAIISVEDFGKTVFLTREEAEQALKGGAEA